ncbi:MAG: T9SS type A sorting domain-containing protein [Flavobacteriales bacterium]|nr:T9SS type A sorting domain-containing protein [Flavobacteriales bacterium]
MKTIITYCVLFFLALNTNLSGQNMDQELISSAGETLANSSVRLDFSLGEISIETASASNVILTQGFHQSVLSVTEVLEVGSKDDIQVFPNPTQEYLNIQFTGNMDELGYARIYSLVGKMVFEDEIISTELTKRIDIKHIKAGQYLLVISTDDDRILNTYRIVKLN